MSRLMFVYTSGSEKGKTRIFTQPRVTIGASDDSDLRLAPEEGGVLPEGVIAEVLDQRGIYQLIIHPSIPAFEVAVNGTAVPSDDQKEGYPLHDGDTLHFGHGLSAAGLLFQVMPDNFDLAPAGRRGNPVELEPLGASPRVPPHPLTATLFVKELTSSLWAEIPRSVKLSVFATISCLAFATAAVICYGFLTLHRLGNQSELLRSQADAAAARRQQDQDLIKQQQKEIDRLREVSEETRLFAQNISERYSPGVCLIVGSYSFAEQGSGRPLKYESADSTGGSLVDRSGNLLASVDGNGPAVRLEFSGTGFVVEDGLLATNKHVVEPWTTDQTAEVIMQQGAGFRPRLDALMAFFPSSRANFELKVADLSPHQDIALCSFTQTGAALPTLPLGRGDLTSITGEPVVLLGYPTGVDGLLQRIDESERRAILSGQDKSEADVAMGLASRGLIRPLTTTGIVTDAFPGKIVHSAHTTEGGSGGPLFGRDYKVIGINSAILSPTDGGPSFGASNFAAPINTVTELLLAYHQKSEVRKQKTAVSF
jgi:serine protease Do